MKKALQIILLTITVLALIIVATACAGTAVSFKVSFDVDGTIVKTVDTNGNEVVTMPTDPVKDGYTFDGWYWDKDVWERPFTANSLMDAPLSSNMTVYAKWREATLADDPNHIHSFGEWEIVTPATCIAPGLKNKVCACGREYLESIPATGHTEVIDPAVPAT